MGYTNEFVEHKVCQSIWGNRPPSKEEIEKRKKEELDTKTIKKELTPIHESNLKLF